MVSAEQQKAFADKIDQRRADEKEYADEMPEELQRSGFGKFLDKAGFGDISKRAKDRSEWIQEQKDKEEAYTNNDDNGNNDDNDDDNPSKNMENQKNKNVEEVIEEETETVNEEKEEEDQEKETNNQETNNQETT